MKSYLLVLLTIFFPFLPTLGATELLEPKILFSGDKEFCFSDGSSLYVFLANNDFRLAPLGLSGRTIAGKWKYDGNGLHISGKWSWINGISVDNDFREMDIHVGYVLNDTVDTQPLLLAGKTYKIYKAYFLIERVEKVKKS